MNINRAAEICHGIAVEKGFWNDRDIENPLSSLAEMALIMTEVAEACEAIRIGDNENLGEELADIIIRVFDSAEARGINLENYISKKIEKNRNRPRLHGKKA